MSEQDLIEASPTKELFISMLTKDVTINDAIGDLVDNSLDGARRICRNDDYSGLWVKIDIKKNLFRIADNCGGISVDIARYYAFRFGRPSNAERVPGSLGQFGIGMKRSLFKLGKKFTIDSTTTESHFVVEIDADKWQNDPNNWTFKFKEIDESSQPEDKQGTSISVTSLLPDVAEQFELDDFVSKLKEELRFEQVININNGLDIKVNNRSLRAPELKIIKSDDFQPAYYRQTYSDGVNVEIFAGISERSQTDSGWYIFCNKRLIVGPPRRDEDTGWGTVKGVPKYHSQYDRFRGYVFLSANNANLLPLNTAKTNMDLDSPIFRGIRQQMVQLMIPVISFLNQLHEEQNQYYRNEIPERLLEKAFNSSKESALNSPLDLLGISRENSKFRSPQPPPKTQQEMGRISYSKPMKEIDEVKRMYDVKSLKEVGEKTFDYFIEKEINQ